MSLHDLAKCIRELTWSEMEAFAAYVGAQSDDLNTWARMYLEGTKPDDSTQPPDQHPEPDSDGWIPHDGKSMPVEENARVEVKFRDGGENTSADAVWWMTGDENWWLWEGEPRNNIIAWRHSK